MHLVFRCVRIRGLEQGGSAAVRQQSNQQPSGLLVSPRWSTARKVYRETAIVYLVFRCVQIRGLEQHGPAAGGATKAPVGLLLVRGSRPVGMSNGRTAVKIEDPNLFSIGERFGSSLFGAESRMPRLRSNESPSGAFKRQRGLRQQMEERCPDKR